MDSRRTLFRLLAVNLAAGIAAAGLVVGGLLAFDSYGLQRLIAGDESPVVAIALLSFGFVITLGSAAMGTAIMQIGREPEPPGGTLLPVRVIATRGRRRG